MTSPASSTSSTPLADRVLVIVGGTSGMGRSAAIACGAAGAQLVVVGKDDAEAAAARDWLSGSALVVTGDARDPDTARSAVALAVESFGRLDGLYHVAGGSGRSFGDGPLESISREAWRETLALNLDSIFSSNQAALAQMLAQGTGGSILNMASVLAFSPSPQHFATHAYSTAKAGILGLTRTCAAYYARSQIRFNAVAPGLVETPMSARACQDAAIRRYITQKQPLGGGRVGLPEDLDQAVVFFLSDQSRFITGQVLAVDGGWSLSEAVDPWQDHPRSLPAEPTP